MTRLSSLTTVWLLLIAATLLTWSAGEQGGHGPTVAAGLLLLAVIKGHAVAAYFMELRHAPPLWRRAVTGWLLLTAALLALAYWKGMS